MRQKKQSEKVDTCVCVSDTTTETKLKKKRKAQTVRAQKLCDRKENEEEHDIDRLSKEKTARLGYLIEKTHIKMSPSGEMK